jgi:hypothetical protein
MQTRPFFPALFAAVAGAFRGSSIPRHTPPIADATNLAEKVYAGTPSGNSGASLRWRQRQARPHGRRGMRNGKPVRQILTNPKFMHRSQRERFAKGQTIIV